ncbi:hypothetical protein [Campylobacter canadensis]|uniref:hypothetical protein n=1 Tax=Campylobacter canadensis TaxID=449520 RepID=UPI001CCC04E3|nr:hypothetical protein [Campylobacter canadensis]MBZ8002381.1 hypothetical protein [Campylobacter canadensis]
MSKNILMLLFCALLLTSCAKRYKDNELYSSGLYKQTVFDIINNDKQMISTIQEHNSEYFNYSLSNTMDKISLILTSKTIFDTKTSNIKKRNYFKEVIQNKKEKNYE